MESTNKSFTAKTDEVYVNFKKQIDMQTSKKPLYDKAIQVKNETEIVYNYIEKMKADLEKLGEGYEDVVNKAHLKAASDLEVGNDYLINKKEGEKLRVMLDKYKVLLNGMGKQINNVNTDEYVMAVETGGEKVKKKWAEYLFAEVPLVADLTILTKLQNDVKNAESEVVKYLFSQINASDFKFDNLIPMVSASKPFVLQGEKFTAEVTLGAYNSKDKPLITVGGRTLTVEDGKAKFEEIASGQGEKKYEGNIVVKDPVTGKDKPYPFKIAYAVFTGTATISADKMNVVYVKLDNEISVSVPGFPPDKVMTTMTGGQLLPNPKAGLGHFIAKPEDNQATRECVVSVSVKTDQGTKFMGKASYRIKRVPKPKALLGTLEGGSVSKVNLSVQKSVRAVLENFVFEGITYKVLSYRYIFVPKGGGRQMLNEGVSGSLIPGTVSAAISSAHPQDMLLITDIKAQSEYLGVLNIASGPTFIIQ
ncbi:MAG: GldM family protein [Bacteroidetes bacterium]|nr:GldM family protein [Bacteroidota bacterium]